MIGSPGRVWQRAYRTDPIVYETIDGVQFLRRRDDQVKLGAGVWSWVRSTARSARWRACAPPVPPSRRRRSANPVLVGYIVGNANPADVRNTLTRQLLDGIVPLVIKLDLLPIGSSGKVDRRALPWPPAAAPDATDGALPAPGMLWSGKEALAEALGDALSYDPRRLESPVAWADGRCGRWRVEVLDGIDGHVGSVCWALPEGRA